MASALEQLRPKLKSSVRVRVRSDGTAGLHDAAHGRFAEVGADQVTLLALLDGQRTVTQLAEAHYRAHRFVPFNALNDLLRTLAARELLDNTPAELRAVGLGERPPWTQRDTHAVAALALPFAGPLSLLTAVALLAGAGVLLWQGTVAALTPFDVLWAVAGVALALTGREVFRAAAATAFGAPPTQWFLQVRGLVPFFAPDGDGVALLDRGPRVVAHVLSLVGSATVLSSAALSRGVAFGALLVLAVDLCPFAPTSAGKLLAALSGRVDLREHARAYLSRRFLRRVTQSATFEGEGSLIVSALVSLAWLGLVARVLLTKGAVWVLSLLALAVDATGAERWLAFSGAGALVLLMVGALVGLLLALWRALKAFLPQGRETAAEESHAAKPVELAAVPFFARLPPDEQAALAQAAQTQRYPKGRALVTQGAAGDCFYALREGHAVVQVEDPSGLAREVARLGPGDCFGETALLEDATRTASVIALTDVSVVALSRGDFERARAGLQGGEVTSLLRASAALKHSPLFTRLSAERLSALALRLSPRRVSGGDVVVAQGDAGTEFFVVGEGELEVVDAAGASVAQLKAGDHFGEVALLRDVPRTATVRARTDALLLSLDKATFLQAMAADLSVSSQLEALAAERSGASS